MLITIDTPEARKLAKSIGLPVQEKKKDLTKEPSSEKVV